MTIDYLKLRQAFKPSKCRICGFGPKAIGVMQEEIDTEFRYSDVCGRYECRLKAGLMDKPDNIEINRIKGFKYHNKRCEECGQLLWPLVQDRRYPFRSLSRMTRCPECQKIKNIQYDKIRKSLTA